MPGDHLDLLMVERALLRRTLHERLAQLGADRLDDVVLNLSAEAIAAWLADPRAR